MTLGVQRHTEQMFHFITAITVAFSCPVKSNLKYYNIFPFAAASQCCRSIKHVRTTHSHMLRFSDLTSSLPQEERQTVAIMHVYISVAAYRSTSVWQPASFLSLPQSVGLYRSQKLTDTYAEPSTIIKSENENV